MFSSKKTPESQSSPINTLIGENCTIQGHIDSRDSIRIDGRVVGNICGGGTVILSEKGSVKGNIEAEHLLVYGKVEGDLAVGNLDLKSTAHIVGNIETRALHIETGAVYQGSISMQEQKPPAIDTEN